MNKLNDEEYWMMRAAEVAKNALCLKAKCGTVIVKGNEIIGEGYNAPPLDDISNRTCLVVFKYPPKKNYDHTCCMHAEQRAILNAMKKKPEKIIGSTLYFIRVDEHGNIKKSGKPYCTVCSRWALDSGIAYFALWHEDGIKLYSTKEYNELSYHYNPKDK